MIAQFPEPYPEELLYSVFCRLKQRLGLDTNTLRSMLGMPRQRIVDPLFPFAKISQLTGILPPGSIINPKRLIENHTILPFYRPFNVPAKVDRWNSAMIDMTGGKSMRSSLNYQRRSSALKYCALCIEEDNRDFKEPYFRRIHQVLGVCACPLHETLLNERPEKWNSDFTCLSDIEVPKNILSIAAPPVMVTLSQDIQNCLKTFAGMSESLIFDQLSALISRSGFCKNPVRNSPKMLDLLTKYADCPLEVGTLMTSEGHPRGPLWGFMRTRLTSHPYPILLLLRALGTSPAEFASADFTPRLRNACPCLNKLCDDYMKPIIVNYDSSRIGTLTWGHDSALICPTCSFGYLLGKNKARNGKFPTGKRLRVAQFGEAWIEKLKAIWNNPDFSFRKIERTMQVSRRLIYQGADEAGLPLDRNGLPIFRKQLVAYQNSLVRKSHMLTKAMRRLSHIRASIPTISRSDLRKEDVNSYGFVYSYNRDWLETTFSRKPIRSGVGSGSSRT